MLSRTADSLFWLARYIERAENVARILSVGHRMASMGRTAGSPRNEWESTLIAAGCEPAFRARHPEATEEAVVQFLVYDRENPSSILSCLETARRNARAVRTALTADMWEALNDTWLHTRTLAPTAYSSERLLGFLEWVKQRSIQFNGAYANSMLRNDAFHFTRLGTFLERADNTARILDVKYHVLLPETDDVGGALDRSQWQAILRAVSALRAYHWVYHDRLKPWLIAELMILRPEMPRSLVACYAQITSALDQIAEGYGGRRGECHRRAGAIHARLRYGRIDAIFQEGLHEFLTAVIDDSALLGRDIAALYLLA